MSKISDLLGKANFAFQSTTAKCMAGAGALTLGAVSAFADDAGGTSSTVTVALPQGVNLTGLVSGIGVTLGGVVAVCLTVWAGFLIIRLAKKHMTLK